MLNKILLSLIGLLTALSGFLLLKDKEPDFALGGGGAFGLTSSVSNPTVSNGAVISTSTLNYLSIGAGTTTVTANTSGTEELDVNVLVVASSTLTDLRWRVEYSHSTSSIASQQLWFPEPAYLAANATTTNISRTAKEYRFVFASSTPHRVATSTALNSTFDQNTTTSFSIKLTNIVANWTRIVFYIPTGASTANDVRMDTLSESTALDLIPAATSTNAGIFVQIVGKNPL